jgi:hypothetical protein
MPYCGDVVKLRTKENRLRATIFKGNVVCVVVESRSAVKVKEANNFIDMIIIAAKTK